jgi:acyl-CoA thioesterase-1
MSSVAIHFASGAAFFSGSAGLVAGILLVTFARRKLPAAIGRLAILTGIFLMVMSATPLPVWAWCVWGATFFMWVVVRLTHPFSETGNGVGAKGDALQVVPTPPREGEKNTARNRSPFSTASLLAVLACTLAAVAWEVSWQLPPRWLPEAFSQARSLDARSRLVVIGDSLSADDFTEGGDPWPTLLAREHAIEVVNLAFSGAKAGSAARRVASEDIGDAVVLVEIGGNDLLGGTTPMEFERDLDVLLTKVSNGPRLVVMLELPLPPLYNRFGEIQRHLARRHNIVFVPKRYFAGVLIGEQATLDGLHLAPAGHRKMAAMVWGHVGRFLGAS